MSTPLANNPQGPSPQDQPPRQPDIEFTTGNIGRWASQQENAFAEQNRQAALEKQERKQKFRKVAPYIFVGSGVIVVALIIWGIIALVGHVKETTPENIVAIAGGSSQDIADYQDILQEFYNQHNGTREEKRKGIEHLVQGTINNTPNGQTYADQIRLAQITMYVRNGLYDAALELSNNVDPDSFDLENLATYYSMLYSCYAVLGNTEKAEEYSALSYEASANAEEERIRQEELNAEE